jgi:hypothetical protein
VRLLAGNQHPLFVLANKARGEEWFAALLANGHKFGTPIDLATLTDASGRKVLEAALAGGCSVGVLKTLQKYGADALERWPNGRLPILIACQCSPDDVLEALVAAGADIRSVDACTGSYTIQRSQ